MENAQVKDVWSASVKYVFFSITFELNKISKCCDGRSTYRTAIYKVKRTKSTVVMIAENLIFQLIMDTIQFV